MGRMNAAREPRLCDIDGCGKPHYGNGLCAMHNARARRGTPMSKPPRYAPFRVHFDHYVTRGTGCWEWGGRIDTQTGYGKIAGSWAHRVSYEKFVGPIPEGLVIDHLCRNRRCVRPDHLEVVTRGENNRRGYAPTFVALRENKCKRGHDLTDAYIAHRSDGRETRRCRVCHLANDKRSRTERAAWRAAA